MKRETYQQHKRDIHHRWHSSPRAMVSRAESRHRNQVIGFPRCWAAKRRVFRFLKKDKPPVN